MSNSTVGDAAIAVVRRNTEEVQGKGNWDLYEELFADDFVDHTPQPGTTPDKNGVRVLYKGLRAAFPDFRPEIHWQVAAGDLMTTYKTYHGTHQGEFLGIPATGKKISFCAYGSSGAAACGSGGGRHRDGGHAAGERGRWVSNVDLYEAGWPCQVATRSLPLNLRSVAFTAGR